MLTVCLAKVINIDYAFYLAAFYAEHLSAYRAVHETREKVYITAAGISRASLENLLGSVKRKFINQSRAEVFDAVVFPCIDTAFQKPYDRIVRLVPAVFLFQHFPCTGNITGQKEESKHFLHHRHFAFIDADPFVFTEAVSNGESSGDGFPLAQAPFEYILDAVTSLVALMLRKRQLEVEHEPPVRCGRIENLFLRALPKDAVLIEYVLHHIIITDVSKPSIQTLKHDNIDGSRLHVLKEPLQAFAAAECLACRCALVSVEPDDVISMLLGVAAQVVLLLGEAVAVACLFL